MDPRRRGHPDRLRAIRNCDDVRREAINVAAWDADRVTAAGRGILTRRCALSLTEIEEQPERFAPDSSSISKPARRAGDTEPGQRTIDFDGDTFAREVIDDVQHAKGATVGEHVRREVERPSLQPLARHRQDLFVSEFAGDF